MDEVPRLAYRIKHLRSMLSRLLQFPLLAILLLSGCATSLSISEMFPDRETRRLARAAAAGNVGELEQLISDGADINAQGKDGITPLFWATYKRNEAGFRFLLEHGANPNYVVPGYDGHEGGSVIHLTMSPKLPPSWLEAILKHGGDPNLTGPGLKPPIFLLTSPESKSRDKLELLKRAGADLNAPKGNFGFTPLMSALALNQYDVVLWLLELGADPRASQGPHHVGKGTRKNFVLHLKNKHRIDPSSHLYPWQKKVEQWLIERGYLEANFKFENE